MSEASAESMAPRPRGEVVNDPSRRRPYVMLRNKPGTALVGSFTHGGANQYACPDCYGARCSACLGNGWVGGPVNG